MWATWNFDLIGVYHFINAIWENLHWKGKHWTTYLFYTRNVPWTLNLSPILVQFYIERVSGREASISGQQLIHIWPYRSLPRHLSRWILQFELFIRCARWAPILQNAMATFCLVVRDTETACKPMDTEVLMTENNCLEGIGNIANARKTKSRETVSKIYHSCKHLHNNEKRFVPRSTELVINRVCRGQKAHINRIVPLITGKWQYHGMRQRHWAEVDYMQMLYIGASIEVSKKRM